MDGGCHPYICLLVLMIWCLFGVSAQPNDVMDRGLLSVVGCRKEGQCVCNIESDWTMIHQYRALKDVFVRLNTAENILKKMNFTQIYERLEEFHGRLHYLESHIYNQSVDTSVTELFELQRNMQILVNLVRYANQSSERLTAVPGLEEELQTILNLTSDMWARNPHTQRAMMTEELTALRERISRCQEHVGTRLFDGDTLPLQFNFGDWCDTHEVEGFGEPTTHKWMSSSSSSYNYGAWYKDPLPLSLSQRTQVWFRYGYDTSRRYFYRYPTYSDFAAGTRTSSIKSVSAQGTGSLLYRGALFYNSGSTIYRYNVTTSRVVSLTLSHTSKTFTFGARSYVSFHADEKGLWVLYSKTSTGELAVSRVDPDRFRLTQTWITNIRKTSIAGAFMICGKVYTYRRHNQRFPTGGVQTTQDVFDPQTNQHTTLMYDVNSLYGAISQLTYNPRERLLFGWDNRHAVTIGVLWKHKHQRDGRH